MQVIRIVLSASAATILCGVATANDWPYWRGPEQTGMTREKAPVLNWSEGSENLLWKSQIGGRTTPIVMNGRMFFIGPTGSNPCLQEQAVCLDAETGKLLWQHKFNVYHTDIVENRVGWTALTGDPETGNVYAHATGGEFVCFDRDGKILWRRSLTEEFGRYAGYGGRLHTPIIDEDRVIISFTYILSQWGTGPAKSGHRYLAFDKRTGDLIWWAQPGVRPQDTTYAGPVVAVIEGRRLLIAPNADGNVYGLLSRTGEKVWSFAVNKTGLNSTPVVDGKYVYVSHGEDNVEGTDMGTVLCIDGSKTGDITKTAEVWRRNGLEVGYSSLAVANGRIYAADNGGQLYCLDGKTGQTHWKFDLGTSMKGSPTVTSDGVIYVGEVNGRFHILRDQGDKAVSLSRTEFTRPDNLIVEIFGSPAIANGRVYFMTRYGTYCLGPKERPADVNVPVPPIPAESAAAADGKGVAKPRLLVVPGDLVVKPGDQVKFSLRAFDGDGRQLKELPGAAGEWSVAGVNGTVDAGGVFRAAQANEFSAGLVKVKVADVEGAARVRVAAKLPVHETFDKMKQGEGPPGWIGVDGPAKIVEKDGEIVLNKLAENPSAPYSRMRAFSDTPLPIGYTVQADIMALEKEGSRLGKMSDAGVINCRYELVLMEEEKVLRLVAWPSEPRLQKDVPFDWKPAVWYRLKFSVDSKDGAALVRGKVWQREETEPADWMIQVTDSCPSSEGSPGLYAYIKGTTPKRHGAPVFFDNYQVTRNDQ